ncbi:MFS transporter [Sporomusaceae bacterium FL31]|nr:MFS transporter [Sporomusaceae bacterium FL31]GCE32985.1 MFS transporter [Sporomusaceae bacterium]
MQSSIDTAENLWTRSFVSVTLVNFLICANTFMLMATLPIFVQHIGGSKMLAGIIGGMLTLTGFATRPFFGGLLDKKGRKLILLAGIVLLLAVTALYHATTSMVMIFILRIIQGLGWSAASTSTSTIAADLVPVARRSEGMGYFGVSSSLAMAIGPALGLYLVEQFSYSSLYAVATIFVALSLIISISSSYLNRDSVSKQPGKDFGKSKLIEKTALEPSILIFLISTTYAGIVTFIPSYAAYKGIEGIGSFFIVYAFALLMTRAFSGKAADRIGTTKVVVPGMVLLIVALIILMEAYSLNLFLAAAVLYGLGFGSIQPVLNALVITLAPAERRGTANATFLAGLDMGVGLGAIGWGAVAQQLGFIHVYSLSAFLIVLALAYYYIVVQKNCEEQLCDAA